MRGVLDMLNTNIHLQNKTPYAAIKPHVMKRLTSYKDDFLKVDKKTLTNRHCKEIILLVRESGTHLLNYSDLLRAKELAQNSPFDYSPYLFGKIKNINLPTKVIEGFIDTINYLEQQHEQTTDIYFYNRSSWKKISFTHCKELIRIFSNANDMQTNAA